MTYFMLLVAYLVGSIPFSVIVGMVFKRLDLRKHGSGNPGTTNAFRVLGKNLGLLVFFLDVFKGGAVILLYRTGVIEEGAIPILIYGLVSCVGHIYPVFLKFKGGKAVATGVGVFLFYAPLLGLVGLGGYFVMLKVTRYVSIASCSGTIALMLTSFVIYFFGPTDSQAWINLLGMRGDLAMPIVSISGTLMIVYRHRGNFKNIKHGVEPKSDFMQTKKRLARAEAKKTNKSSI